MIRKVIIALLLLTLAPQFSLAIPTFSRQTGASCRVCHFQNMHSLNKYGRDFLRNGFHETEAMKMRREEIERMRRSREAGKHK